MFDTNTYITLLQANTNRLTTLAASIPLQQLHEKPDGKWSNIEILEHVQLLDRIILVQMLKIDNNRNEHETVYGQEKLHAIIVELRNKKKVIAPDFTEPTGKFDTITDWQTALETTRTKFADYITTKKIVVDNRQYAHPYLGNLTMVDWCYLIISHAERHCLQIEDRLVGL